MSQYNLNRIFKPRQVAVVGASEKAGTIGNALMRNLIDGGFSGTVLPVNPKYQTMHGQACFESVSVLETGVDLAVIATPIHSVADIVGECVEKKVGGAVIISAGGKEVGAAGPGDRGEDPAHRSMTAGFVSWDRTAWALFGPVILFGMGGIYTEVLKDRALGLPPMNRLLARRLMQETKAYSLLQGYRNRPAADMQRLEEMIIRLSQLLIDFPEIAELDMNPVLIKDGKPVAVDARILVSPLAVPSSLHLVIGPYPNADESHMVSVDGRRIFVRPVKPEDSPLFTAFFKTLSPTTIYYGFFGALKELNPEMLARLTQIDYDRRIAQWPSMRNRKPIVCWGLPESSAMRMARRMNLPFWWVMPGKARASVKNLLQKCLSIAEKQGFQTVNGVVLTQEQDLLALGKKLGF